MKKLILLLTLITFCFFISCDDDSTSPPKPCSITLEKNSLGGIFEYKYPITVTYSIEKSGDGTISKLSYFDDEGEHEITNPKLNWKKVVTINSNDISILLTADGETTNGSLKGKIDVLDAAGNTASGQTSCVTESN